MTLRANPYFDQDTGDWFWSDENDFPHGPFRSQGSALFDLLDYMQPSPWWERLARWITKFVACLSG